MATLKSVIEQIQSIVGTNPLYKSVGEGNIWEFDTKTNVFPAIWIDAETNIHQINNGSVVFIIDVYFIDLVYNDEVNELVIKSDTFESAQDFVVFLQNNFNNLDFYVKDGNYSAQVFSEKWTDKVSGTKLTLNVTLKNKSNNCNNIFTL